MAIIAEQARFQIESGLPGAVPASFVMRLNCAIPDMFRGGSRSGFRGRAADEFEGWARPEVI